jgi:hypothetical protein
MVLGAVGYGAKKVAKKVATKKAAAKATPAQAASAAKRGEALRKMQNRETSATTMAQDIRREISSMRSDAKVATASGDRRMAAAGAGGTAALAGAAVYNDRKKKRGGAMATVKKARDRSADERVAGR